MEQDLGNAKQSPLAPTAEASAKVARKGSLISGAKSCTCHPDDARPVPCARQYAYSECVKVAFEQRAEMAELLREIWECKGIASTNNRGRMAIGNVDALLDKLGGAS